jgi:hypothetical protein
MSALLHDALQRTLRDATRSGAFRRALAAPQPQHLDDEDIAAFAERSPRASALAHALSCPTCEARVEALAPVLQAHVLPQSAPLPEWIHAAPLFAALERRGDQLHLLEHTGVHRYRAAERVRSTEAHSTVGLRDRADQPRWELQLMLEPDGERMRLHVDWLDDTATPKVLRASSDGRILAETPFRRRTAALTGLRAAELRVDAVAEAPLAIAWLSLSRRS